MAGRERAQDEDGADALPATLHVVLERARDLRYGENPHQRALRTTVPGATRAAGGRAPYSTADSELSYLNLLDAEAAWQLVHELVGPHGLSFRGRLAAAVIVKHTNACGAAVAD